MDIAVMVADDFGAEQLIHEFIRRKT